MKRVTLLISGLFIAFAFSVLLVRIASLERENAQQRKQNIEMRDLIRDLQREIDSV